MASYSIAPGFLGAKSCGSQICPIEQNKRMKHTMLAFGLEVKGKANEISHN
jgi:hypothetical protein